MNTRHAQEPNIALPEDGEGRKGPGQQLRVAREAAQLSIGQAAAHLRLDTRTVTALEADRYEALPAPIFVRGYLRSYARLLDLAPEPLVAAFDQRGLEPPSLIADIAQPPQTRTSDLAVRLGTYAIIIGLSVLVGLWWQSRDGNSLASYLGTSDVIAPGPVIERASPPPPLTATPAPPAPPPTPAQAATAPTEPANATPPRVADAAVESVPESPDGAAPTPESTSEPAATIPAATVPPTPSVAETSRPMESLDQPQAPPAETTPPPAAAEGAPHEDHLRLRLAHESWIEVYDRNGDRLYYNLAQADSEINLSGQSPFRVLFGYAGSTSVWFNGVQFDPTPFAVRGAARFVWSGPATPSGPRDLEAKPPPPPAG